MIKISLTYGLLFFMGIAAVQWGLGKEINWLEIISMSIVATLIYLLFEWVDKRDEQKEIK